MKKIGVFIDLSNLYYCTLNRFGRKPDYKAYLQFVKDLGDVTHAFAYGSQIGNQAQQFIYAMNQIGYVTRYKQAKAVGATHKANWDVGIVMEVVQVVLGVGLDVVVLGTADGDMAPLVDWCQKRGIPVVILASGISHELRDIAHKTIEMPESLLETKGNLNETPETEG
jgi:uncharacterized LabA/DUF88 family protein